MLLADLHTKKRKLEEMKGKSCDRSFGEKKRDCKSNVVSRPLTPDMFEEDFPSVPETMNYPDVALQIEDDLETEESASPPSVAPWRGMAMSELKNRYSPGLPPVQASANHAVLFQLPVSPGCPLKPYPHVSKDRWDSLHVRMPSSSLSLYPVENAGKDGEEKQLRPRWELVQEALLKPIPSSKQLQDAIFSYNSKYSERWDFSTLHTFFSQILGTRESTKFFSTLLPQIIGLALQLPSLVTGPIPLLVQHRNQSVSLTQLQVASLLANAFLCTFPRRNTAKRFSEYYKYPDINFNRLFHSSQKRFSCCIEKLRCLIHYFHRVCTKSPEGVLTYSRQYLSSSQLPDWTSSKKFLPQLHISSSGTIEKEGGGFLQVDFANKMVGGGVLGSGCVQEEIRFIICPELIVSRLFTEELNSTEALIVTGCERYSNYVGYGDTFEWLGDYVDTTPRDSSGRRLCTVAAIDALNLPSVTAQFAPNCLRRELNKAYTGFLGMGLSADKLSPVATGNWGCGAFRGDAHLKALLQLMAAGQADRDLVYFTFGDAQLRDDIYEIHAMLTNHGITVGELWHMLVQYNEHKYKEEKLTKELYPYLHKTVKYLSSTSRYNETLSRPGPSRSSVRKGISNNWLSGSISSHQNSKTGQTMLSASELKEALQAFTQEVDQNEDSMEDIKTLQNINSVTVLNTKGDKYRGVNTTYSRFSDAKEQCNTLGQCKNELEINISGVESQTHTKEKHKLIDKVGMSRSLKMELEANISGESSNANVKELHKLLDTPRSLKNEIKKGTLLECLDQCDRQVQQRKISDYFRPK